MKKEIDCLLIGHNEINFDKYERMTAKMGQKSGIFRDLNLNYIFHDNTPLSAAGYFNAAHSARTGFKPVSFGNTFSAAIAYLGSFLNRNGLNFGCINSFQEEKERLTAALRENKVLTVAILTTLYVFALPIVEIVDFIKEHDQEVKIIVGGPFISTQVRTQDPAVVEYLFEDIIQADFFVNSSQGETTLVNIIRAIKNNTPVQEVNNIYYNYAGRLDSTPLLTEDNRLSANPVNWDLFSGDIREHVNVRTAISCPFSCSFCGFPKHAGEHQVLDTKAVERELDRLHNLGKVKSINFIDDTFNVPLKRFKDLLRMMIKNKYSFKWHSYFRCQYADRETVQMMKDSGCEGVFLGIESGNEQILENMNKASKVDKYREGIRLLKEEGIVTFGSFITGFPGETQDTARDTIRFIKTSGLDFYRTQLWYCEPITPIWDQQEKYNIKGGSFEWSHNTMNSVEACDLIDEMFLTIEDPIWMPQYNFDFDSIWYLIHQGMSMEEVRHFLRDFYYKIRKKLEQIRCNNSNINVIV